MSTLTIERTFPVTPEKVFAFLTQTDNLLKWWGPEGTTISQHDLDFSRRGDWWAVMHNPAGAAQKVGGAVVAIDPPRSVEFTLAFIGDTGTHGETTVIRFEVSAIDTGGSHFLLTQTGVRPEHIDDMRDKGWASSLARLERLVLDSA